jgi:peptide/nickel transport system substrate-binding protein
VGNPWVGRRHRSMTQFSRRQAAGLLTAPWLIPAGAAWAQSRKSTLTLALTLEPPGLDPTTAPSASIGEIVHYNVLEGLTRIQQDGSVVPLLAEAWSQTPDGKVYTFKLRRGVKFSDGSPLTAEVVKFSFDRARAPDSTNKAKKVLFNNISSVVVHDAHTVMLVLDKADATLPFRLGENTAVILHPSTAAQATTRPVGTGPFTVESWAKGSSVTLRKWDGYRYAPQVTLQKVVFRFINDSAAQVAALLAGDVDAMPRLGAFQAMSQLRSDPRLVVEVGTTTGKGLLAINNRRKPLNDVRVRRAIAHAIDRQAFIDGAQEGLGRPIGSHFVPTDLGYVDETKRYAYSPERARALLKEAGITTPLNLTLSLPPPPYARKGGEIIAAQLAEVGINARIENVEWAQWLSGPFKGQFDLTIINHVEPLDYATAYADPNYYFGYDSSKFRQLVSTMDAAAPGREKNRLWKEIQQQLAEDAVNAWIWNPAQVAVYRKGLKGIWRSSPIFANDLAAVSWE